MPRPSQSSGAKKRPTVRPSRRLPVANVEIPMLRTSERGTFKRCRWKWWLEFDQQLKPNMDIPALRFGSLIHGALAAYYKPGVRRGPKPAITFEKLYEADLARVGKEYDRSEVQERWEDAADLGVVMLERYHAHYHPDDEWKVLVTEFPFKVIIEHPKLKRPWFYYTGILDGVWQNRSHGRKVIPDHKTAAAIQTGYLAMDPQATAYWTIGVTALQRHGLLAPDGSEKLDGMLFNFLRKAPRSDKTVDSSGYNRNKPTKEHYHDALKDQKISFDVKMKLDDLADLAARNRVIVLGEVSKVQPAPYHARVPVYRGWYEREGLLQSVIAEWVDMEDVRKEAGEDGMPAAYKNPGQFTCPGCWALDICELHEIGQDWLELRSQTTHTWAPYDAHEIREGR